MKRRICMLLFALASSARAGLLAPLSGGGDFNFVVDAPVFADGEGYRIDLAAAIRHPELRFEREESGRFVAQLQMFVKAARQGTVAIQTQQRYTVHAESQLEAQSNERFAVLDLPIELPEGRWALTVQIHDVLREQASALGKSILAGAQGVLEVPERGAGRALLSDPEFQILGTRGEAISHPMRLYGVVQDTLLAYLELSRARPGRDYVVDVEVRDPIYGGMDSEALVLRPDEEHSALVYRLPLGSFPDGSYRVRFTPQWDPERSSEYEFGVNWRIEQVLASVEDVSVEGALIFDGEVYRHFRDLSNTGQQAMLARFWEEIDPTPGTAVNETREIFRGRMAYAERNFGSYGVHGALSDRGRVYVRYGAPRDIAVEVIPLNGSELEDSIGKVHDSYRLDRHGTTMKSETDQLITEIQTRPAAADVERNARRVGSEGSFELWTYSLDGDPLFPKDRHFSENVDFRFLFVDRKGSGFYELEFSNLPTQE